MNKKTSSLKLINSAEMLFSLAKWDSLYSLTNIVKERTHVPNGKIFALRAVACFQLGKVPDAFKYAKKAIEVKEVQYLNLVLVASCKFNISALYTHLGDKRLALINLNQFSSTFIDEVASEVFSEQLFDDFNRHKSLERTNHFITLEQKSIVSTLFQKVESLCKKVFINKENLSLFGQSALQTSDPFLSGKFVLSCSSILVENKNNETKLTELLADFKDFKNIIFTKQIKSWGILFCIQALVNLDKNDLLLKCFTLSELIKLEKLLDWRLFIDAETLESKIKSNNFYGVAHGIAEARYALGWDSVSHSNHLMKKMLDHYRAYSTASGYADESEGKGRFDRYSFLLIAEIAHSFRLSNLPLIAELKDSLRLSADYVLYNLNLHGNGFQYGRSIGAYGDTAFLEILTAAAWFKLLSKDEERAAYSFSLLCTKKFLSYWWNDNEQAVNLWFEGRVTDSYRGPDRVLGESFSLLYHHLYTQQLWLDLGYSQPDTNETYLDQWIKNLSKSKLTWFKNEKADQKAVFTWRKNNVIYTLPLINGDKYYKSSNYLPTPYSSNGIKAIPDREEGQLVPKIRLKSKEILMPICDFTSIEESIDSDIQISWCTEHLINIKGKQAEVHNGISVKTKFVFSNNYIKRYDKFSGAINEIESIFLEWFAMPELSEQNLDTHKIHFENEEFISISFEGYENENSNTTLAKYNKIENAEKNLCLAWTLHLNNQ